MQVEKLLEAVRDGQVSVEEALKNIRKAPFEDMEFAKLDYHRRLRSGFGEVVYCRGKSEEHLVQIYKKFAEEGMDVMGTRATEEQYRAVKRQCREAEYDAVSGILKIQHSPADGKGLIAVCSAGTADIPVAEEAAQTAEFLGGRVERIYDVGVAGIHRLFAQLEVLQQANCVVAVAGMEGALGSVVAGLVPNPVIAVPTSVGYGANLNGISALLTMINSCANGITVVNIDNGFGAGYSAAQINRLALKE